MRTKFKTQEQGALALIRNASELLTRHRYSALLGQTFGGSRDLYNICGYDKDLSFDKFWSMFTRSRLGRKVITAPVESTWRGGFQLVEGDKPEDTAFEKAFKELDKKFKFTNRFSRLDKLVGLGQYGILLFGFNDGVSLREPLSPSSKNRKLAYLQTYHQGAITVSQWETNQSNERFGMPVIYAIDFSAGDTAVNLPSRTVEVHYTRILHVAEELLCNEILGTPRMEASYNTLSDIEKICAGSAEMFWQGALGGKAFTAKDGFTMTSGSLEAMQTELDEFYNGLRRHLRLQGVDIEDMAPSLTDPKGHLEAQLDILSGITGIPKRILLGSERGELASIQDESNWLNRVKERRELYAGPQIIRPTMDMLIESGVLIPPQSGEYQIKWPDLWNSSEKEQADTSKIRTEALAVYINAPGIEEVVPIDFFLEEILKFTPEQIDRIKQMLKDNPPLSAEEAALQQKQINDILAGDDGTGGQGEEEEPPQGGKVAGKKPPVRNTNPCHDSATGQFCSTGGGSGGGSQQAADESARALAQGRGYRVPPAWHHVTVASDPSADLQVTGIDTKGRKQYIYSAEASQRGAAQKFARLKEFTKDYPDMINKIENDMKVGNHTEEARTLYLISKTGFRIGSSKDTGASQQAFGASTLLGSHVTVKGNTVTFNFTGKKGVVQNHSLVDKNVASWVRGKGANDKLFNTDDSKVRDYLHGISGKDYKVKDFRTYVATSTALQAMKSISCCSSKTEFNRKVNTVAKIVSEKLGNTPAMAKNAYINPAVWAAWQQ